MRRNNLLLIFIPLFSFILSAQIRLPASNIRKQFFVIRVPSIEYLSSIETSGVLFANDKAIGQYSILLKTQNMVLCQLDYGNLSLLTPSSYVLIKPPQKPQPAEPKSIEAIETKPAFPVTTSLQDSPTPLIDSFETSGFTFKKLGTMYISINLFPFTRFGTIENLNSLLDQLNSSKPGFTFNIPSDTFIRSNLEYFKSNLSNKFLLCLINNTLGYAYFPISGDVIFKTISTMTVTEMPEKFFVFTVASK